MRIIIIFFSRRKKISNAQHTLFTRVHLKVILIHLFFLPRVKFNRRTIRFWRIRINRQCKFAKDEAYVIWNRRFPGPASNVLFACRSVPQKRNVQYSWSRYILCIYVRTRSGKRFRHTVLTWNASRYCFYGPLGTRADI